MASERLVDRAQGASLGCYASRTQDTERSRIDAPVSATSKSCASWLGRRSYSDLRGKPWPRHERPSGRGGTQVALGAALRASRSPRQEFPGRSSAASDLRGTLGVGNIVEREPVG